ncbi:MAG TPA: efflux RND transporter periplasmic adaptor subunit [Puia sp.]|jgi:RND family efflux transporter MFP subunit|nr:efflux RND transporter periplasmic adaptor subunit [Puia sp.]
MRYSILFVAVVLFFAACTSDRAADKIKAKNEVAPAHYQLDTIEKHGVASVIKLPGQLAAYEEVSIYPRVNGYVKSVLVDIGSQVSKGQLLMELEAPELLQATMEAREKYARSLADFSMSKEHYQRLLEAAQTAGAVSPLDLSTLKSRMMADSALSNAEKSNWQVQQTMLSYLRVTAPFDGVITERNVHPGTLISASGKDKPVLELKQVAHLRLQVDIPENLAVNLKDKDSLTFYTSALPGTRMTGYISRKSMNVNTEFRSERMEADVMNKSGRLSPGMYADVLVYSNGNPNGLTVPRSAVVTSTERKYVIVVRDGKTVKVNVSTGNESGGKVEIVGAVAPGEQVITNANDEIKEGIALK